jgi:hypothetical protein
MQEEYNYNLTVPLDEVERVNKVLAEAQRQTPQMRLARKPDRGGCARFYLCFPIIGQRTDLAFIKWFNEEKMDSWDLFGPNYGVWGLK